MTHLIVRAGFAAVPFAALVALPFRSAGAQEPSPPSPPLPAAEQVVVVPPGAPTEQAELPRPPRPAPYSLPFQLRPVTAGTVLRSDSSFASYENRLGEGGSAFVSGLLGSFRIPGTGDKPGAGLAPLVKLTLVTDSPPPTVKANGTTSASTGGLAIVNPLLGATYALSFGSGLRASAFLGLTIPVGMGGGNAPAAGPLDSRKIGPNARAGMENALFAVNDFTVIPGVDLAYVNHGFTAQLEATLFQLERVRGAASQPEQHKTNFTSGLHVGYFLTPALSIGAELRYQRWINAPIAVDSHAFGTSVDLLSLGVGPRLHFNLAPNIWIRPGIAYTRGFDHPLSSPGNYNIFQLDVPVAF